MYRIISGRSSGKTHQLMEFAKANNATIKNFDYKGEDVVLDFELYTADSVSHYHGMYQGPAMYR